MEILAANIEANAIRIIVACLLLVAAIIILWLVIAWYRRRILHSSDAGTIPWTLDDVQRMYEQGDITKEEFQAMRKAIIAAFSGEKAEISEHWDWIADSEQNPNTKE